MPQGSILGEIAKILQGGWYEEGAGTGELDTLEFIAIAYFVNYFEEFRLQYNGRVQTYHKNNYRLWDK